VFLTSILNRACKEVALNRKYSTMRLAAFKFKRKKAYLLLCFTLAACLSYAQQPQTDSLHLDSERYSPDKEQVSGGGTILAAGGFLVLLSRLVPAQQNTGLSVGPQGRDVVLLAGLAGALIGTVKLLSSPGHTQKIRAGISYVPYSTPLTERYMPALTFCWSFGNKTSLNSR
jgi:hypothetical protein